jgi:hypothetical protein
VSPAERGCSRPRLSQRKRAGYGRQIGAESGGPQMSNLLHNSFCSGRRAATCTALVHPGLFRRTSYAALPFIRPSRSGLHQALSGRIRASPTFAQRAISCKVDPSRRDWIQGWALAEHCQINWPATLNYARLVSCEVRRRAFLLTDFIVVPIR